MTSRDPPTSPDTRFAVWIGATVALFLVAVLIGFVWLPSAQRNSEGLDLWNAICRAVGLPNVSAPTSVAIAAKPASTVAWTAETRRRLAQGNAVRGAALATTCNNCHGANGISADAAFPNLAGQSVDAIYKQLEDYRSGKRNPTVMGVFVSPLSEQDILDLATHFASLPSPFAGLPSKFSPTDISVRDLIEVGDPARGMAPCAACHGPLGSTPGAPGLRGQQRAYLEQQMQAFVTGDRRNDIREQMRTIARQLTSAEIAMIAAHYSNVASNAEP
ncbi:MAG TPA: c-type cytochrome [Xanthobacteraceae bacterium]|nr:c-type cytochrome [Xanthobacteraceae bacterium]